MKQHQKENLKDLEEGYYKHLLQLKECQIWKKREEVIKVWSLLRNRLLGGNCGWKRRWNYLNLRKLWLKGVFLWKTRKCIRSGILIRISRRLLRWTDRFRRLRWSRVGGVRLLRCSKGKVVLIWRILIGNLIMWNHRIIILGIWERRILVKREPNGN